MTLSRQDTATGWIHSERCSALIQPSGGWGQSKTLRFGHAIVPQGAQVHKVHSVRALCIRPPVAYPIWQIFPGHSPHPCTHSPPQVLHFPQSTTNSRLQARPLQARCGSYGQVIAFAPLPTPIFETPRSPASAHRCSSALDLTVIPTPTSGNISSGSQNTPHQQIPK